MVPFSPTDVVAAPNLSPGGAHYFGTDATGLDVFSRTLAATRNDLLIATLTAIVATAAGIRLGLIQAVPAVVIALALVAVVGTSVFSLTVAMAIILIPNQARMVRTEVLRVRGEAYIDAARMAGERELGLTLRHVLPNASWPALENASLVFGAAVFITATLGFLLGAIKGPIEREIQRYLAEEFG